METFKIKIWDHNDRLYADDSAPSEAEAREAASNWTNQRGQMRWMATVYDPGGKAIATYRRGEVVVGC